MLPTVKPRNPNFSSGPCAKRPGYNVAALQLDVLGRSHRSALGKKALGLACTETARLLGLPEGYRVAVVPASDTGAVEMAMWSLLGPARRGRAGLGIVRLRLGDRHRQAAQAAQREPSSKPATATSWTCRQPSTSTTTWSSPGTAPPRA
jgi:phosphoserine aminotransferase